MTEQSGSLAWNISGPSLTKFLSSPNGAEFTSETFNAGSFTFQCKVYPNGRKKEQRGCVMLYFVLQSSLTSQISKITVKARLYCPQTLCDWKHIQHLKKDNAGIGWHSKNMLLSEAQQHSHLKFLCQITILRIEYQSSPKGGGGGHGTGGVGGGNGGGTNSLGVNIYHKLSKMNVSTVHQWEMSRKLLDSFRAAHCGKFYHSMDYNWDSFCTSVAPNGGNLRDAGNVKCGIQLLQLPAGIGKIKCKFSICCNVGNLQCDGKKEFSYNSTFIAWGDGTLSTKDLLNTTGTVYFRVTITITKCFDEFHHEIARSSWHKYGVINHKEDGNGNITSSGNTGNTKLDPLDGVGVGGIGTTEHHHLVSDPAPNTKTLFLSPSNERKRVLSSSPSNHRKNGMTKPRGASVPRLDQDEHRRIRTQITNRRAPPVPPPRPQQHNGGPSSSSNLNHSANLNNGVAMMTTTTTTTKALSPATNQSPSNFKAQRSRAKSKGTVLERKQKEPLKRQYTEGIRANESKIDATKRNLQHIAERIDLMESHRSEDREYLVEMEQNLMNLQKSQHRIQQQQFVMLKDCIHELQATVQRLSSELIHSQNRIKKLEKERHSNALRSAPRNTTTIHGAAAHHVVDDEDIEENKEGDRKPPTKQSKREREREREEERERDLDKNKKRTVAVSSSLALWLSHDCGFPQYIGHFVSNGYDRLEIVKEMSKAELKEIGISLKGHLFKIAKEIEKLQQQQKHHRGRSPLELDHVATYLTPVDSPAPNSPMFTIGGTRGRGNSVPVLSPSAKEQSPSMYSHSKLFLNLDSSQHGVHALHRTNPLTTTSYHHGAYHGKHGNVGNRERHGDEHRNNTTKSKFTHSQGDGHNEETEHTMPSKTKPSTAQWVKPQHTQSHGMGPTVTANMNMNLNVNMSPTDSTSSYQATATTEFGSHKRFLLDSPNRGPNRFQISNSQQQRHLQLLDMWECAQCQNHNLGTLWKCEFCGRERSRI